MAFNVVQEIILSINARLEKGFEPARQAINRMTSVTDTVGERTRRMGGEFDLASRKIGKMNWHFLSTLFFGMALMRTFNGLLQPAMDAAGIFEIIGATLEILMLPFVLALIDPLLAIMDYFTSLPEEVQFLIGAITALVGTIGSIIFFFSQIFLGTGGTILMLKGFVAFVLTMGGTILSGLSGVVAAFASLPIAIIAIIVLLVTAILFNIEGFIQSFINLANGMVTSISRVFEGLWDVLMGFLKIFTGDFEGGVRQLIGGVIKLFQGFFGFLYSITIGALVDFAGAFAKGFSNAFKAASDVILGFIPQLRGLFGWLSDIWGMLTGLGAGLGNAISGVSNSLFGFGIPAFANGGIVNRPTLAMVGEAGPEAIIPLREVNKVGGTTTIIAPVINLQAEINNELDVRSVSEQIIRELSNTYGVSKL